MSSAVFQIGGPLSGIASTFPQCTSLPNAATSWHTENSGITTSIPNTVCPAIASRAITSAS